MVGASIDIHFDDFAAEQRFIESTLANSWDQIVTSDAWDSGWYWRYGQFDGIDVDGGLVRLVFDGDPDALIANEQECWEAVPGLSGWSIREYPEAGYQSLHEQQCDAKGPLGGDWEYRYKPLTAALALQITEEFGAELPAVTEPTDQNPVGLGMWSLVHALFVQSGYDWYEENSSYLEGLKGRIKSIAHHRGEAAAREEYERVRERLEAFGDELDEWIESHPTGRGTVTER